MVDPEPPARRPIVRRPGQGRLYDLGRGSAVFKADNAETGGAYAVSQWRLEAHTEGPGLHSHAEDDIFFVTEGTMSVFVEDHWIDATAGSFVLIPGGTAHDFANRSDSVAAFLNVTVPGGFEPDMAAIAAWFRDNRS